VTGLSIDDPELVQVVTMLRAERRRRAGWWAAGVSAAAAASVAVAVPAVARFGGPSGIAAPAGSATTSLATAPAPSLQTPSGPPSLAPVVSLQALFGRDWSTDGTLPGGFGGDLALMQGSPSAQGLPDGYRAAVRSLPLPTSGYTTLDGFCARSVEKGATFSACRDLTTADGVRVHRVDVDAPNLTIGTWRRCA
jgi:hypothetical protein